MHARTRLLPPIIRRTLYFRSKIIAKVKGDVMVAVAAIPFSAAPFPSMPRLCLCVMRAIRYNDMAENELFTLLFSYNVA